MTDRIYIEWQHEEKEIETMKFFVSDNVNDQIVCNNKFMVENNIITVDRSREEDVSDLPKGVYRTRSC